MTSTPRAVASRRFDPAVWAPAIFVGATLLGVLMRLEFVGWSTGVPFDHLLHAHSHALYFGWAGLAVLALAGTRRGWPMAAATWGVPVMAVTFLWVGYAPLSIIASTVMMIAWYVVIGQWWADRRTDRTPVVSIVRTGFLYVILASLGVWALAVFKVTGVGEPLSSRVAIHSFLSNFGWFFLIGTVAMAVDHRLIAAPSGRRVVVWWASLAWFTFPLGVAGGAELPFLGVAARVGALALAFPTWLLVRALWTSGAGVVVRSAAGWLFVKALSDVALAIGGDRIHELLGRQGVVIYLHATLLGYVTTMAAWYLGRTLGVDAESALTLHQIGTLAMLIGIGLVFIPAVGSHGYWIGAIGALTVWTAGLGWAAPVWRRALLQSR